MQRRHPLLRVALLACPGEFRRYCGDELAADLDPGRASPLPLWLTCLNIIWIGLRLHAENIWRDVAFATRVLAKAPVFIGIAVLTIALAIAANVTAFSIFKAILLDPLPYPDATRLAFISGTAGGQDQTNIDYPDTRDFALRNRTFTGISVETQGSGTLAGVGEPVTLRGWYVDGDYFNVLGIKPELGRLLSREDLGAHRIVISDALWRGRFAGDASILGRRATIDGQGYTIIGVAPPHLLMPGPGFMTYSDYWIPVNPRSANWRGFYLFYAIGRVRGGVSWTQAQEDLSRIASALAREYPSFDAHRGVRVQPLFNVLVAPTRMLVIMQYAAAVLVLLIAAANIVNLLFVRAATREHDLAVRTALGATRKRIAMQFAMETGLISIGGFCAGIVLSWWCLYTMSRFLAAVTQAFGTNMIVPGWNHVGLSAGVLFYGVGITMLLAVGTALAPAYIHGEDLTALLNAAGRAAGQMQRAELRRAVATFEIVLAFAVVCTAGLLLKSFVHMERRPVGFREANMYTVQVGLPPSKRYRKPEAVAQFYLRAQRAFRALPDVAGCAIALGAGLGHYSNTTYSLDRPISASETQSADRYVEYNLISPGFFATLAIPLLQGRDFRSADTSASQPVAIVSKGFALEHFRSVKAALDKYVSIGVSTDSIGKYGGTFPMRRIVGVVADVRHSLADKPAAEVYVPFAQLAFPGIFVIETKTNDPQLAQSLNTAVHRLDPLLPPPAVISFALLRGIDDEGTRAAAMVFLSLAVIALVLALAGVYGVVAYGVQRRTQEFGVRMSLGASASTIALHVMREALFLGLVGIAIGTVLAAFAARGLTQFLFETSPLDAGTYFAAAAFLFVAIGLAACLPALRATRVQPALALRSG